MVDDYAHHPTEISAVLAAAKRLPYQRVVALFQPHRFSRTMHFAEEFGNSFGDADVVIINEIYGAFEKPIEGVSAQLIVDALKRKNDKPVYYGAEPEDIMAILRRVTQPGDLVMVLGAGNIRKTGEDFALEISKTEVEA